MPNAEVNCPNWTDCRGFRAEIALSHIKEAQPNNDRVYSWGAHGWHGRWLVNGSSKDIVEVTIDP